MANLPTVPQADIENALEKMNRPSLDLNNKIFSQLQENANYLKSISNTLAEALQLDELRMSLEKQREGLLIEAQREAARKGEKTETKSGGSKLSIKDLLGFDPSGLQLALLAAALGAAAIAIKTQFEELATAIQGFVAFKLGSKVMDLLKGLGGTLLAPFRALANSARSLGTSFKESKLASRIASLADDFRKMKFPVTVGIITTAFLDLRNTILRNFGINPDGRQMRDAKTGRFIQGKMSIQQQIIDDLSKMFRRVGNSIRLASVGVLDEVIKFIDTRFSVDLKSGVTSLTERLSRIGSSIRNAFSFGGAAEDAVKVADSAGKETSTVMKILKTTGAVIGELLQPIKAIGAFIGGTVFDVIGGFFRSTGSVISGLFDFIKPILTPIKAVLGIVGKFSIILTPFFALYDFIVGFWKGYSESEGSVLSGLEEGLLEVFRGFFTKPLDLLREYIVAPFVGLFSKDAEKAVKDFSITDLFNSVYNGVKSFIKNLIGDPSGTIGNIVASLPNPIEIIGEKLFSIFSGVAEWIQGKSFLPDFLASPFEFLAEQVAGLFDIDATGKTIKPIVEGNPSIGAGGTSAQQVSSGTATVREAESSRPIQANISAPQTTVQTTNNNNRSQHVNIGGGASNSDAPRTSVDDPMKGFS